MGDVSIGIEAAKPVPNIREDTCFREAFEKRLLNRYIIDFWNPGILTINRLLQPRADIFQEHSYCQIKKLYLQIQI